MWPLILGLDFQQKFWIGSDWDTEGKRYSIEMDINYPHQNEKTISKNLIDNISRTTTIYNSWHQHKISSGNNKTTK